MYPRAARYRRIIVSIIGMAAGAYIVAQYGLTHRVNARDLAYGKRSAFIKDDVFVQLEGVRAVLTAPYRVNWGNVDLSSTLPSLLIASEDDDAPYGLLMSNADRTANSIDIGAIRGRLARIPRGHPAFALDSAGHRHLSYAVKIDEPRSGSWLIIGAGILLWGAYLLKRALAAAHTGANDVIIAGDQGSDIK